MKNRISVSLPLLFLFVQAVAGQQLEVPDVAGMSWFKGNTHTHTNGCDGDSSPEVVAQWYKDRGYQFLVLTDHYMITIPQPPSSMVGGTFLLIPGEELTCWGRLSDIDTTALNIAHDIPALTDKTLLGGLQKGIDAVRAASGTPVINHPNMNWRLDQQTILGARDCRLFELFNGYSSANNEGDDGHPSMEDVWDFLLTAGMRIYGIAADDTHYFNDSAARFAKPGTGWVVVRSRSLDADEIVRSLDSGLFYSSTGVELADVRITPLRLEIQIKERGMTDCTTDFIAAGGRVLRSTRENPAVYDLSAGLARELTYIRARVTDSSGSHAWVQPVFVVRDEARTVHSVDPKVYATAVSDVDLQAAPNCTWSHFVLCLHRGGAQEEATNLIQLRLEHGSSKEDP
jgi:hypothetical protein